MTSYGEEYINTFYTVRFIKSSVTRRASTLDPRVALTAERCGNAIASPLASLLSPSHHMADKQAAAAARSAKFGMLGFDPTTIGLPADFVLTDYSTLKG